MYDLDRGIVKICGLTKGVQSFTILIDTSGSMYKCIDTIKEVVLKLLNVLIYEVQNARFNIISCSKMKNSFSDSMVPCTRTNLKSAREWTRSLQCETSTNILSALVRAFDNDRSDIVIMFTDGLPNERSSVVLKCTAELSQDELFILFM